MKFERGISYLINYGTSSKLAMFLSSVDGINYFRDISGKFALSDNYIKEGKVTITEVETD